MGTRLLDERAADPNLGSGETRAVRARRESGRRSWRARGVDGRPPIQPAARGIARVDPGLAVAVDVLERAAHREVVDVDLAELEAEDRGASSRGAAGITSASARAKQRTCEIREAEPAVEDRGVRRARARTTRIHELGGADPRRRAPSPCPVVVASLFRLTNPR